MSKFKAGVVWRENCRIFQERMGRQAKSKVLGLLRQNVKTQKASRDRVPVFVRMLETLVMSKSLEKIGRHSSQV